MQLLPVGLSIFINIYDPLNHLVASRRSIQNMFTSSFISLRSKSAAFLTWVMWPVSFFIVNNHYTAQKVGLVTANIGRGAHQRNDCLWFRHIALHTTTESTTEKFETIRFVALLWASIDRFRRFSTGVEMSSWRSHNDICSVSICANSLTTIPRWGVRWRCFTAPAWTAVAYVAYVWQS